MYQPLADLLRPTNLDEVYGQEHILGKGAVLRRLIDSGKIPNMIFYGPSGTGKTTVANIIAKQTNRTLFPSLHPLRRILISMFSMPFSAAPPYSNSSRSMQKRHCRPSGGR